MAYLLNIIFSTIACISVVSILDHLFVTMLDEGRSKSHTRRRERIGAHYQLKNYHLFDSNAMVGVYECKIGE